MTQTRVKRGETATASIYIAGDVEIIKQVCREYCLDVGLCVTVTPTTFVYTGGEESGAMIGLINYPRYPSTQDAITQRADDLAKQIMLRCCQWSFSVVTPKETLWHSRRPEDA